MTATLKGTTHRYVVDLKIDAHTLAFEQTPQGLHRAVIECTVVGYDAEGRRLNYEDGGNQIVLKADQYASILTKGLPVRMALDLPAGEAFLRVAVHDKTADRAGSLEVPVMVAAK